MILNDQKYINNAENPEECTFFFSSFKQIIRKQEYRVQLQSNFTYREVLSQIFNITVCEEGKSNNFPREAKAARIVLGHLGAFHIHSQSPLKV